MGKDRYICCSECDEIVKVLYPHKKGRYKCPNCSHTLFRYWPDMIERVYAISLAAFFLLIITLYFPFLSFEVMGNRTEINFFTSIYYLYKNQDFILAITVLMTTVVIPFWWILNMILVFGPIYNNYLPKYTKTLLKIQHSLSPWGMLDVFLVGVLVSIVKLVKMGTIIIGISLYSLVGVVVLLAYLQTIYDPHMVWDMVDEKGSK